MNQESWEKIASRGAEAHSSAADTNKGIPVSKTHPSMEDNYDEEQKDNLIFAGKKIRPC